MNLLGGGGVREVGGAGSSLGIDQPLNNGIGSDDGGENAPRRQLSSTRRRTEGVLTDGERVGGLENVVIAMPTIKRSSKLTARKRQSPELSQEPPSSTSSTIVTSDTPMEKGDNAKETVVNEDNNKKKNDEGKRSALKKTHNSTTSFDALLSAMAELDRGKNQELGAKKDDDKSSLSFASSLGMMDGGDKRDAGDKRDVGPSHGEASLHLNQRPS